MNQCGGFITYRLEPGRPAGYWTKRWLIAPDRRLRSRCFAVLTSNVRSYEFIYCPFRLTSPQFSGSSSRCTYIRLHKEFFAALRPESSSLIGQVFGSAFLVDYSKFCKQRLLASSCLSVSLSIHLSVRTEQLGYQWTDFHKIWYLSIFRKFIEKFQVSLKPDKNIRYFTWRQIYVYDNIVSYPIVSYHIVSYRIISYHIVSYHIISYIISYHIISYHIISYHIISYHISYHIISYHIISYHIISYHIVSYIISYHIISYHIISYHIISYHIISYHIILYQIISYHIISYHIISYHIISYHKTDLYKHRR